MPKRILDSQTTPAISVLSEHDIKSSPDRDEHEYESESDFKPNVSQSKKAKKSPKKESQEVSRSHSHAFLSVIELTGQKRVRNAWTEEEENVYLGMMSQHLQETFWQKVKEDGRLAYRGPTGIKAHVVSTASRSSLRDSRADDLDEQAQESLTI